MRIITALPLLLVLRSCVFVQAQEKYPAEPLSTGQFWILESGHHKQSRTILLVYPPLSSFTFSSLASRFFQKTTRLFTTHSHPAFQRMFIAVCCKGPISGKPAVPAVQLWKINKGGLSPGTCIWDSC